MTGDRLIRVPLGVLGALAAVNVLALDPMPIKRGGIEFIPTIGLSQGYDSNVQEAPKGSEISSAVTRLTPSLLFRARERANRYELSYRGVYDFISSGGVGNRFDHHVLVASHMEFAARHRLDLSAGFDQIQNIQNLTNRQYNESGDIYNVYQVGGVYGFGALSSKARLDVAANYRWVRYLNNLHSGSMNIAKDYDSPAVTGTFFYRVAPKTRLLAELGYAQFNYISSGSTLGSYNLTYLAGVTWQATAKTRGTIKVGYGEKHFSSGTGGTVGLTSGEATVTWSPTERAEFTLAAKSFIGEGSSFENNINTQTYRLSWDHKWAKRVKSQVFVSYMDQQYQGGTYAGRDDKTSQLGLRLTYNLRRWVDVELEANFKQLTSNAPQAGFDRNWYFLNFIFSL